MKRKKISLVCALLSLLVAMIYVILTFVLLARAVGAKAYVPTAESDLWIIQVLKRLKQTSFNLFFSAMGIVLCFVLAVYRLAIAYFYNKVSKSDETFYKALINGGNMEFSYSNTTYLPDDLKSYSIEIKKTYVYHNGEWVEL